MALAFERRGKTGHVYALEIWSLVAFLGRYGNQPANVMRSMPVLELKRLADAVGELVAQENNARET